jgi:hypothetical protein
VSDSPNSWLIPVLIAAGVAIALLLFWPRFSPPERDPAISDPMPAATGERRRPGPLHPLVPLESSPDSGRELVPLPALSDSDAWFRLELLDLFGTRLDALLTDEALIEKFVATVDNLPRKHVAERIRPVGRLEGVFLVEDDPESEAFLLAPENFGRYDFLVNMIAGTDIDRIVDAYRRYYPLLQEAYVALGYPEAYFNDRVVAVIDDLLATPRPVAPIRLVRPHVLYEFANPELEALSSGQKLLLRMGPDNAARVLEALRALRARIAMEQIDGP